MHFTKYILQKNIREKILRASISWLERRMVAGIAIFFKIADKMRIPYWHLIFLNYWTEHCCKLFCNSLYNFLMVVEFLTEVKLILSSLGEISQIDVLMLFGIHSMKKDEIAIKSNFNSWNKHILFKVIFYLFFFLLA